MTANPLHISISHILTLLNIPTRHTLHDHVTRTRPKCQEEAMKHVFGLQLNNKEVNLTLNFQFFDNLALYPFRVPWNAPGGVEWALTYPNLKQDSFRYVE